LVEITEWKRSLGRPRYRLEDKISTSLREIVWEGMDCMNLPQHKKQWDSLSKTVIDNSSSIKCGEFLQNLNDYEVLELSRLDC